MLQRLLRLNSQKKWRLHKRYKATLNAGLKTSDDFLVGSGANYIDAMYEAYRKNPSSVHVSWQKYFADVELGKPSSNIFTQAPLETKSYPKATTALDSNIIEDHLKIQLLVRAYQVRGHLLANLDPLGIVAPDASRVPELDPAFYGFAGKDLNRSFQLGAGVLPAFRTEKAEMTLEEIIQTMKHIYCQNIGYEYAHIPDRSQCDWLRARIEVPRPFIFSKEEKQVILDRLVWADSFERFVASKWPGEKRFGLEGAEALIPGMKSLIDRVVNHGVETIVMGMSHRGRLNVLGNVVRKPMESIFCEFSGVKYEAMDSSGDVKYHLGMNYDRPTPSGRRIHLSLVANPSHLEAVDPVVIGKAKALQFYMGDEKNHEKAVALLIHGDAAFAGQGVVYETLGMYELPNYTVGGTIHLIINNQIGFTTDPRFARSTPYCSDIAKTINAPVFHVNGDDPEAVVYACQLAADWRTAFKTDVVIDMVCYRRHGHNEVDQPAFTQPRMYAAIAKQPTVLQKYSERLSGEGTVSLKDSQENKEHVWAHLEKSYAESKTYIPTAKEWLTSNWNKFMSPKELHEKVAPSQSTGVDIKMLRQIGIGASSYPSDFEVHPGVKRIMEARIKTIEEGANIDMPTAEALAFGTLLVEGIHVRLSGQDVERGTFSQRHAVLHNQSGIDEDQYIPLQHLSKDQAKFVICNSSLSEFGAMGFELGYSLVSPYSLVCWEAQFGDFANSAQCIIDQFLASGERKWLQRTGLTLLLPHGYDGGGPEHSNARIERFLSLCDDNPYCVQPSDEFDVRTRQAQDCNWQIINPTTPANYFHVLRRQILRDFRKPLILFNSKSLLRHPLARSTFAEMAKGTRLRKVIPDQIDDREKVERIILCSGQIYYALARMRQEKSLSNVAIIRIEQLAPFPYDQIIRECDMYPNACSIIWCQEEPMNLGPWFYMEPRLETALRSLSKYHAGKRAKYTGRCPSSAVATGFKKQHVAEELDLLEKALLGQKS